MWLQSPPMFAPTPYKHKSTCDPSNQLDPVLFHLSDGVVRVGWFPYDSSLGAMWQSAMVGTFQESSLPQPSAHSLSPSPASLSLPRTLLSFPLLFAHPHSSLCPSIPANYVLSTHFGYHVLQLLQSYWVYVCVRPMLDLYCDLQYLAASQKLTLSDIHLADVHLQSVIITCSFVHSSHTPWFSPKGCDRNSTGSQGACVLQHPHGRNGCVDTSTRVFCHDTHYSK